MKKHVLLAAFTLLLAGTARADDAADCNQSQRAPDRAIIGCTHLLDAGAGAQTRGILLLRSRAYAAKKQFDAALADTEMMAKVAPDQWNSAILARAYVHGAMKDADAEIADYTEILNRRPGDFIALSNRCSARVHSNRDPNEAVADCMAVTNSPAPGPEVTNRAFLYLRLGRFKDALADYDYALSRRMAFADCYYGRGIAKARLGDAESGKADIAQAVAMQSDVADLFTTVGLTP